MQFPKLPFTTLMQLIDAAAKGAKFEVITVNHGSVTDVEDVTAITEHAHKANAVHVKTRAGKYGGFNSDGTNHIDASYILRMIQEAPAPAAPFLKQFVNGTPAYNPKTRETVKSMDFVSGAIKVTLVAEDGTERVSTRYDHEGRHRWVAERSLVLGDLPPKPVVMKDLTLEVFTSSYHTGKYVAFVQGSHSRKEAPHATVTVQVPA